MNSPGASQVQTKLSHYAADTRVQCDKFLGVYANEKDTDSTRLTMLESVLGHLIKEQILLAGFVPHTPVGDVCSVCGQNKLHVIHHPLFVFFGKK